MDLRNRIIQKASELFFYKGVRSVTMSDVANEAGISKRTLYEAFRDKDELLEVCVNTYLEAFDHEVGRFFDTSGDVITTLMRIYSKHLQQMHEVNNSTMHDVKKYYPHIYAKIEARKQQGLQAFIPLFQKGVKEGLIREELNFEVLLWLVKAQFKALMDDNYMPTDKYSANEFIRAIILNFVRGIATPKGSEKIDAIIDNLEHNNNKVSSIN